ncbi:VIP peptides isoform X2 [Erpetoichthys calabaricus]|uniref:Vasoactive intestinal peptide b n=1 Tax=Erpetoichthys calabaricus TaxID=27687 RepID=A0A8C4RGW2_ERPCA|nr:VIP peptides isoform X2 [Erpetoichthys calabaricus]XP_039604305.1 VIP peptides isoform X2 [Polypterus senegalus]
MLQRKNSQILLLLALCSVLYSKAMGLPALGTYSSMRATRHADGLFTSGYSKLLGQLSARRYLESLIGKRVSNDLLDEQMPVKRHSDAIFTDNYSRFRKQMAVKKYLNSVLAGKRSQEDMNPAGLPEDASINENFSENLDDVTVDDLLNHIPLTL